MVSTAIGQLTARRSGDSGRSVFAVACHRFRVGRNMSVMAMVDLSRRSDTALLALTPKNAEAFGVFYDRYERAVLAFFRRATGRTDLAADLTGEVFAAALESAIRFDPEHGTARAWLFGIARHELADLWERGRVEHRARERLGIEPLLLSDEAIERIDRLDGRQDGVVLELLDELPEDQRVAVKGRVVDDRGYAELAQTLSCSPSVARQRVSRGLRNLRDRLKESP
jgi:RNA polymerase sigma factor (sigma-70 family)